jgi:hypothetical protein
MSTRSIRLAALGLSIAVLSPALLAAPPAAGSASPGYEPGEKWRLTTSMSMAGMTMPGRTMEVCSPKGSGEPPKPEDQKNCTVTDMHRSGNKQTAHMHCTTKGGDMDGDMEMESLGPDHYRMAMHMKMAQGSMDMNTEGQKLGGECDAGELKRKGEAIVAQAKQAQAQSDKLMADQCHQAAQRVDLGIFTVKSSPCTDPADKTLLCGTAQGYKGFGDLLAQDRYAHNASANNFAKEQANRLADTGAFCGFQPEALRNKLCNTAERDDQLVFLAEHCPVQAAPLAKAQCAGRGYTGAMAVAAKYRGFCGALHSGEGANGDGGAAGDGTAQEPPKPQDPPKPQTQSEKAKDAIEKGKAKLKGLFGG